MNITYNNAKPQNPYIKNLKNSKSKSVYEDIDISHDKTKKLVSTSLDSNTSTDNTHIKPIISTTFTDPNKSYNFSNQIDTRNQSDDPSETEDSSEKYESYNNYFSNYLETELKECNNDIEKNLLKQLIAGFNPIENLIKNNLPTPRQLSRIREHNKYKKDEYYTNLAIKREATEKSKAPIKKLMKRSVSDKNENEND